MQKTVWTMFLFFFQAEDGIRDLTVTGVQTCALPISTIARFYSSQFITDLALLNINSITRLAHVSDYVSSMEKEISKLVEQNIAYSANGNIYLDVSKVKDYGIMSKQSKEQLNLHRLDIGPHKKNQEDVMLWNCSEDFGFFWPSKFGKGIPWWHMQDT